MQVRTLWGLKQRTHPTLKITIETITNQTLEGTVVFTCCWQLAFKLTTMANFKNEVLSKQEIKAEYGRLCKMASDMKYFASTLEYEHQKSTKAELLQKAKDFQKLADEYKAFL